MASEKKGKWGELHLKPSRFFAGEGGEPGRAVWQAAKSWMGDDGEKRASKEAGGKNFSGNKNAKWTK